MKATIGVYEDQAKALAAIQELKAAGFPEKGLSILHRSTGEHPADPGENEEGPGIDSDNAFQNP